MSKILLLSFCFSCFVLNTAFSQLLNAEQIYTKINKAVVTIYTFDANGQALSQGSGVVLNEKGWVVTNYHVYAGAEKLVVKYKNKAVKYTGIVGLDVEKDILILKIADNTFPFISIGNSDLLKIGQKIYAIGSPMGLENTMTEGIVSGLRSFEESTKKFIQISAPISPESSGGAVVDSKGKLIAITTLTVTKGQNLNFAIPINEVLGVYKHAEVKPNSLSASLYNFRGINEYSKGNYSGAINYYKESIALDPSYFSAYANLGSVYGAKGDIESGITYLKKAIEIQPYYSYAYYNLGVLYSSKNEVEAAIFYLKKAISIDSEYYEAYFRLGLCYGFKQETEPSILYYEKALSLNPYYVDAYYHLGLALCVKRDFGTGIVYLKKAIALNPDYSDVYYGLGAAYANKGEVESAIPSLKRAIELNPKFAEAYFLLGVLYQNKGDVDLKNYYLNKAFELNPSLKNSK